MGIDRFLNNGIKKEMWDITKIQTQRENIATSTSKKQKQQKFWPNKYPTI